MDSTPIVELAMTEFTSVRARNHQVESRLFYATSQGLLFFVMVVLSERL